MVMEQYLINDTTLSAIGDAIRQAKGEEKYLPTIGYSHTPNIDDEGNVLGSYGDDVIRTEVVTIPGASSLKITITYQMGSTAAYGCICIWEGNHPEYTVLGNYSSSFTGQIYRASNKTVKEYTVQGDSATFGFYTAMSGEYGYYAVVEGEGSNSGAINPDTNYLPSEIPQQITEITTLDTLEVTENGTYTPDEGYYGFDEVIVDIDMSNIIPEEGLVITGDCTQRFSNNGWNWYIDKFSNQITTKDILHLSNTFYYSSKITEIPFELNMIDYTGKNSQHSLAQVFYSCSNLLSVPKINNAKPSQLNSIFYACYKLREIPSDFCENWDWSYLDKQTSTYAGDRSRTFFNCYGLRSFPMEFFTHSNPATGNSYSYFYYCFNNCYCLNELIGLPLPFTATWTSNTFASFVNYCARLKNLTFALQEDGTPYVMKWKTHTLDLSTYVGYTNSDTYILNYNSGITADKQVKDDATYQALKNDPDWWTKDIAYSRYNHDSAVATINSLPDTSAYLASAGGTNTIKFKGAAGSATDGGAINTLTEEEIAVAAAKGWTVTLV